jgi:aspartate/methionine/tyrosine aminotransferase
MPPGWIDLAVGEAHIVRQALVDTYPSWIFDCHQSNVECDYQPPNGYPPLVKLLERRYEPYGARVVITAGAKQALAATFYAAKLKGMTHVAMRAPYWSQMPAGIRLAGLQPWFSDEPVEHSAYLLVSPNNPDGAVIDKEEALRMQARCKALGVPFVHDAAYHTPTYGCRGPLLAGTSVHSVSKSHGLSGLRIGYLVTDDPETYQAACEYVEAATVGVSLLSQRLLERLFAFEEQDPPAYASFVHRSEEALRRAKEIVSELKPEVLDASNAATSTGMFGWFKAGPRFNADAAQVHVAPGYAFGDPSRVRLNLAVDPQVLREAVKRLNALA